MCHDKVCLCDRLTSHLRSSIRAEMQSRARVCFMWVCKLRLRRRLLEPGLVLAAVFTLCRHWGSTCLCTLTSFCHLTQSQYTVFSWDSNSKLLFPSRPQFSTSQHNHLCRAQHRHAHRQRFHRHPSSAQRTPRGGDCVHQRPAALLHPEPHRGWHPPASLHRSTAIHRWGAGMLCLLRCISYLQCAVNAKCLRDDYCEVTTARVWGCRTPPPPWHHSLWVPCLFVFFLYTPLPLVPFFPSPLLLPLLYLSAAIYPATTLTPIGQTLPQPPQVIQQQQQREGEGERTLLLLHFTYLIPCKRHIKWMSTREQYYLSTVRSG